MLLMQQCQLQTEVLWFQHSTDIQNQNYCLPWRGSRAFYSYLQCLESHSSSQKMVIVWALQRDLLASQKLDTTIWKWLDSVPALCFAELSVVRPVLACHTFSCLTAAVDLMLVETQKTGCVMSCFSSDLEDKMNIWNLVKHLLPFQDAVSVTAVWSAGHSKAVAGGARRASWRWTRTARTVERHQNLIARFFLLHKSFFSASALGGRM